MIDLRSDTVTQPTEEMRAAMARAEVGDDVFMEDPTVERLQEAAAAAVGMEAALFVPTGTMGNLLAVKCHTQTGDQVVVERHAHLVQYELGGLAWFSGAVPQVLEGRRGVLDPDEVEGALQTGGPYYGARTGLLCVENTHNYGGGAIYPRETLARLRELTAARGVPLHMDGARLFNAAVALGVPASELARHADTVMFCFSKGLSAPVGSVLCGPRALIERARRYRRAVGGGMRQAGVLAAACQVALERQVARLAEDHAMARRLAEGLALLPGLGCNPETVETNIVMCWPHGGAPRCARLLTALRAQGVLLTQLTPNSLRAVTHRHIGPAQVDAALAAFRAVLTAEPA